nr:MAG TPA: hypothetical protein [Caudoviricetes sp.]
MFIKFSELPIPFGRLALGAVLTDTEGLRWLLRPGESVGCSS